MRSNTRMIKSHKGFSLIELIVVVSILAVLIAVAAPRFIAMTDTARVAAIESNLGILRAKAQTIIAASGEIPDLPAGTGPGTAMELLLTAISGEPISLDNNPRGAVYDAWSNETDGFVIQIIFTASSEGAANRIYNTRSSMPASSPTAVNQGIGVNSNQIIWTMTII